MFAVRDDVEFSYAGRRMVLEPGRVVNRNQIVCVAVNDQQVLSFKLSDPSLGLDLHKSVHPFADM